MSFFSFFSPFSALSVAANFFHPLPFILRPTRRLTASAAAPSLGSHSLFGPPYPLNLVFFFYFPVHPASGFLASRFLVRLPSERFPLDVVDSARSGPRLDSGLRQASRPKHHYLNACFLPTSDQSSSERKNTVVGA
ncbi:hypothetical protein DFJ73DRAFT_482050 [Zopfochytrium polystomum]|nr:hypothetical protein DFJ73DRAFT_482050 [Zopfochytrium polystomum]